MDAKSQTIGKVMKTTAEAKYDGVITLHLIGRFLEKIIEGSYRYVQTSNTRKCCILINSVCIKSHDELLSISVQLMPHREQQ